MERPSHKTPRVDCLESQRPRLTHFSTMAARNRFQTALPPNPLDPPTAHIPKQMILLSMILPILRRRFAAENWDAKGLACPTLGLRSALPRLEGK